MSNRLEKDGFFSLPSNLATVATGNHLTKLTDRFGEMLRTTGGNPRPLQGLKIHRQIQHALQIEAFNQQLNHGNEG